jgi:hypothetical protein
LDAQLLRQPAAGGDGGEGEGGEGGVVEGHGLAFCWEITMLRMDA